MRTAHIVLFALLIAPLSQAQFYEALPYEAEAQFAAGIQGIPAMVSAQTVYNATDVERSALFFGTEGATVSGLAGLYWQDENDDLKIRTGTNLSIQVSNNGAFGFRTPEDYDLKMDAGHSLSFFVDAGESFRSNDENGNPQESALDGTLGRSMAAIPTDESIEILNVGEIPEPPQPKTPQEFQNYDVKDHAAMLISLSGVTTLTLFDGETEIETLEGVARWVGFHGSPVVTPMTAELAILPMPDGAVASFVPGESEVVARGLDVSNLVTAFASLANGLGGESQSESGVESAQAGFIDGVSSLAPFLNGAYLDLGLARGGGEGGEAASEDQGLTGLFGSTTLVRFDSMDATRSDDQLAYEGEAALQVKDGEVAGAQPLVGGVIPQLGIILWLVAAGGTIALFMLRPSKKSEFWDGFHLIGRIAGPVTSIVAFFIWDAAIADLLGASIIHGGLEGTSRFAIAALELVPLFLAGLFFGIPTRLIFRAGTRFAGQGRMMNIGNVVAPIATLVFGLPLLLSLVNSALSLLG